MKVIIGLLVAGFLVAYSVGTLLSAGKQLARGASTGLDVPLSILSIAIALALVFSLGQEFPYIQPFDWAWSLLEKRRPIE